MNKFLCVSALCVLWIGYITAARVEDGFSEDSYGRDFYIDDEEYRQNYDDEGSSEYSGLGEVQEDDEDSKEMGSGGSFEGMSDCEKIARDMRSKDLLGAYTPRCTETGEYEAMQCRGSTGECWCVNYKGKIIPGTLNKSPWEPECEKVDRSREYPDMPEVQNPKDVGTGNVPDEGSDEIDNPVDNGEGDRTDANPGNVDIGRADPTEDPEDHYDSGPEKLERKGLLGQPLILAGLIAIAVVCLLCAVLLVMFIVYRMRKKDEGSYALDEPKRSPSHPYQRAPTREYFA